MICSIPVRGEISETAHFWFTSERQLEDLWRTIAAELKAKTVNHDHENVWEWIEAKSKNGMYQFNISRKHRDTQYPVHIKVSCLGQEPTSSQRDELGKQLAKALKAEIKYGVVKYLEGNEFQFQEKGNYQEKD